MANFELAMSLAAIALTIGILWVAEFARTGNHSLREMFLLVAYWGAIFAVGAGTYPWHWSH